MLPSFFADDAVWRRRLEPAGFSGRREIVRIPGGLPSGQTAPTRPRPAAKARDAALGNFLNDLHKFVDSIAVSAGKLHEALLGDDEASLGCSGDSDAAAAAEVEESFVAELAQCAEDGVVLTPRMAARSFRWRESFAGPRRRVIARAGKGVWHDKSDGARTA